MDGDMAMHLIGQECPNHYIYFFPTAVLNDVYIYERLKKHNIATYQSSLNMYSICPIQAPLDRCLDGI